MRVPECFVDVQNCFFFCMLPVAGVGRFVGVNWKYDAFTILQCRSNRITMNFFFFI